MFLIYCQVLYLVLGAFIYVDKSIAYIDLNVNVFQCDKDRYLCQTYLALRTLVAHLAGQASRFLTLRRSCMRLKCAAVIASPQTLLNPQDQFAIDFGE
jgi:hypothetical protein